uniref:YqxG protein n=1 Tax=Fopius arisanus TaxID=64838 RepID=A0A0C9RQS7_9HYME
MHKNHFLYRSLIAFTMMNRSGVVVSLLVITVLKIIASDSLESEVRCGGPTQVNSEEPNNSNNSNNSNDDFKLKDSNGDVSTTEYLLVTELGENETILQSIIDVPLRPVCPSGQRMNSEGLCKDIL